MDLEHEKRLTEVEARSKSNAHRLDEVEKRQDNLDKLVVSVEKLALKEENVESDVLEPGVSLPKNDVAGFVRIRKLNIKRLLKHLDDRDERRTRAILIETNTEIIDGGDKANKSCL